MLTFKDNEKEIMNQFFFMCGGIKSLLQYKQVQDYLSKIGFEEKKQSELDLLIDTIYHELKVYENKRKV